MADFLDQSPEDFLQYSPEDYLSGEQKAIAETAQDGKNSHTELAVGVALSVAFLVWRQIMKRKLREERPESVASAYSLANKVWKRVAPAWMKMATPAIAAAYKIAEDTIDLSDEQLEWIATEYASSMGEYLAHTSSQALVEGYTAQVAKNFDADLAWDRVTEAYGLDPSQMRSTMQQVLTGDISYPAQLMPDNVLSKITKMLQARAQRVGRQEAWGSMQMGKSILWMYKQQRGDIPANSYKQWITADDERVCPTCGPLHLITAGVPDKFVTENGSYWAPSLHINCRCNIVLVIPEVEEELAKADESKVKLEEELAKADDPWDETKVKRDEDGQFARQTKAAPTSAPKKKVQLKERTLEEDERQQVIADLLSQVAVEEKTVEKDPFVKPADPFRRSLDPFAQKAVDPFAVVSVDPFAQKSETTSPFAATSPDPFKTEADPFKVETPEHLKGKNVAWIIVTHKDGKQTAEAVETTDTDFKEQNGSVGFIPYYRLRHRINPNKAPWLGDHDDDGSVDLNVAINADGANQIAGVGPVLRHGSALPTDGNGIMTMVDDADPNLPFEMRAVIALSLQEDSLLISNAVRDRAAKKAAQRQTDTHRDHWNPESEEWEAGFDDESAMEAAAEEYAMSEKTRFFDTDEEDDIISNYYPKIVMMPNFYGKRMARGDSFVAAGKYKIRQAEPHAWTAVAPGQTVNLPPELVKKIYDNMEDGDLIEWTSDYQASDSTPLHIQTQFPELFTKNPWSRRGTVGIMIATPEVPPGQ